MEFSSFTNILIAIVTAFITSSFHFWSNSKKLERDYKLDFAAERVATRLLSNKKWGKRTFVEIKKRLGGFGDDELRQILVKSGAVRFHSQSKGEMWGLLDRNLDQVDGAD